MAFIFPSSHNWWDCWEEEIKCKSYEEMGCSNCEKYHIYRNAKQPWYRDDSRNAKSAKKKNILLLISYTIHKACQILSAFTSQCHCSITVSALIFLTLTANITIFFMVMPLHRTYNTFWNPSKSLLPCCCDPLTKRSHTMCFMILPARVKAWPLVKSHTLYSCYMVLEWLLWVVAVVRWPPPPPRYDHNNCVRGTTSNCGFRFWS